MGAKGARVTASYAPVRCVGKIGLLELFHEYWSYQLIFATKIHFLLKIDKF